jgi:hypothetical protein
VRGLRNSWAATSLFETPCATSRTIWSCWGVSSVRVLGSRLRAVSPVARSSPRARCSQGAAPRRSKALMACRSSMRASLLRRARRRCSPYSNLVRASSKRRLPAAWRSSAIAKW